MLTKKISLTAVILSLILFPLPVSAQGASIQLPLPRMTGGKPLMETLKLRKSTRSFDSKGLPFPMLADLLWAAGGVNRPESGLRTAPSAHNAQEILIYVALAEGLYLYNAEENTLDQILNQDIRAYTGHQKITEDAPVNLIYVADFNKISSEQEFYSAADTAFISQNVYLFCASQGLATVVLGWVDKESLAKKMGLSENQKVILTQPVGYPK